MAGSVDADPIGFSVLHRSPLAGKIIAAWPGQSIRPPLLSDRLPAPGQHHRGVQCGLLLPSGSCNRLLSPAKYAAVAFFSKYACNPPQSVLGERLAGKRHLQRAPVAQLDRAPDYESGGQRFESFRARHFSSVNQQVKCRRVLRLMRSLWRAAETRIACRQWLTGGSSPA